MSRLQRLKAQLGAFFVMLIGCGLIFAAILLMNGHNRPPEKEKKESSAMMVVKENKKKPRKQKRSTPKRKTKTVKAEHAPLPNLSSAISSVDLGIPGMDIGNIMGLSSEVVGSKSVENMVMSEDSVDVVPRPLRRSPPEYPPRARAKNLEGHVTLRVLIGKRGNVEKVKVVDSSPSGVFDEAAMEAVRGWEFEPALYRGEQVRVWAKQTVRFKLG